MRRTVGVMLPLTCRAALSLVAALALVAPFGATGAAFSGDRAPSPRWAEITRVDGALSWVSSRHDNNLTITRAGDRVVFRDPAARRFRKALPTGCRQIAAATGIAASCRIPAAATGANPLVLKISPQGGNDRVDGSSLGSEIALTVLPGAGDDTVLGGAAADKLNGALGLDTVTGGAGDDTIVLGDGNDIGSGGAGEDRVTGGDGNDELSGGDGEDQLEGGPGNDLLLGGAAADALLCGTGTDTTDDDGVTDGPRQCEEVLP